MDNIVYLIFRRMRRPLITLVLVYALSILGLVLIPGQDDAGNPWHMDFFHAFYFVSYMSTTIGFGEIPYAFNDAQRLWVTVSMYAGVIAWLYAIGTILALVQDKTFQRAIEESRLAKQIRSLKEPFFLVCGYGETGSALVKGLTEAGQHAVVIEINEQRSNAIRLESLRDYVPTLHGDAQKPVLLQEAGLQHPLCQAVVAVTNDNKANLKIAITSKLLHPDIRVICRADSRDIEKNMASFGTDFIIDPFDTFANYLSIAIKAPCLYLLQSWLFSGAEHALLHDPIYPPKQKHWIICGYGRFGKALYERLKKSDIEVIVIEATPEITGEPPEGVVRGRGTEANTLLQAKAESASGLIAGTDDDANNLSIVVTARELNPNLFFILRQNHSDNSAIINAVNADMVMQPSKIIAGKINARLTTPMLSEFMSMANKQENEWACELVSRISALVGHRAPLIEEINIDCSHASAVYEILNQGGRVILKDLLRHPWKRRVNLKIIALMIKRQNQNILLPGDDTELEIHDRILFCAENHSLSRLYWNLQNENILSYARLGRVEKHGWLWSKFSKKT